MATNFPTNLDSLTNPSIGNNLNNPPHADQHANANDAIEALEAKVGINASAVTTSHDYKIAKLETGWVLVGDSWSYASADAPTFTITVPSGAASKYSVGMRIKLTQTTVKYFIITAVADTVLTVYGGTDYTLVNAAISAISYSTHKAPLGFPLSPSKWTVEATNSDLVTISGPVGGTWYDAFGVVFITLPIGVWDFQYNVCLQGDDATAGAYYISITMSPTAAEETDADLTCATAANSALIRQTLSRRKTLTIASKTGYRFNMQNAVTGLDNIRIIGTSHKTIARAVCAYL